MIRNFLLAGLGGAIGTMMRLGVYLLVKTPHFPLGTLLINITGSFMIGYFLGMGLRDIHFDNNWKIFLATGLCGGFTTFSAFSQENFLMLQHGKYFHAFIYIFASVVAGILASWIGYKIATN